MAASLSGPCAGPRCGKLLGEGKGQRQNCRESAGFPTGSQHGRRSAGEEYLVRGRAGARVPGTTTARPSHCRKAAGDVAHHGGKCGRFRRALPAQADAAVTGAARRGGLLECAYHGLCYDGTGQCVRVPSYPDGHIPREARLHPFPVIEQDVLVWIWPGDPAKRLTENELSDFSQLWHDSCSKAIIEAQDVDRNHSTEVCARGTALRKRCHGCGMEYNLYD